MSTGGSIDVTSPTDSRSDVSHASENDKIELPVFRVCDSCRVKKSKCDMERPACGACLLRRTHCVYSTRRRKPGPRKGTIPKRTSANKDKSLVNALDLDTSDVLDVLLDAGHGHADSMLHSLQTDFGSFSPPRRGRQSPVVAAYTREQMHFSAEHLRWAWDDLCMHGRIPYLSPVAETRDGYGWPSPEMEEYLFELYFQHLQPLFPIFRRPSGASLAPLVSSLPARLKLAVFAVSYRFLDASTAAAASVPSGAEFARQASAAADSIPAELAPLGCPDLDEIKATFLLCLYGLSESLSWNAVADISRLTRMAEMYAHFRGLVGVRVGAASSEGQTSGASTGGQLGIENIDPLLSMGTGSAPTPRSAQEETTNRDDTEEWASVWWCIYALETCSSALAASLPTLSNRLQRIALPTMSIAAFTSNEAPRASNCSLVPPASSASSSVPGADSGSPHFLPAASDVKLWETMSAIFSRPTTRTRNLHLGTCSLMRAVTDLRCLARAQEGLGGSGGGAAPGSKSSGGDGGSGTSIGGGGGNGGHAGTTASSQHQLHAAQVQALRRQGRELESDCAAAAFSLPPWFSNPAQDVANAETEDEHRDRLHSLLLWHCSRLLLVIVSAQAGDAGSTPVAQWQTILSRAHDLVRVVQNWRPSYFAVVDPMCSYIVFVTGAVVALDMQLSCERPPYGSGVETGEQRVSGEGPRGGLVGGASASTANSATQGGASTGSSGDWDLIMLFLCNVGRYWRVGRYVADSLSRFRKSWAAGATYDSAIPLLVRVTGPFSELYLRDAVSGTPTPAAAQPAASKHVATTAGAPNPWPTMGASGSPDDDESAHQLHGGAGARIDEAVVGLEDADANVDPDMGEALWLDDIISGSLGGGFVTDMGSLYA